MLQTNYQLQRRLWRQISSRRRGQFAQLLVLMTFASFAEIISIGVVLPFIAVLTAPNHLFTHPRFQSIIKMLGLTDPNQLVLPLTITFILSILFAAALRLILLWASNRLSFATGADLSSVIYRRTLYQPYAVHISRSSSAVIDVIGSKAFSIVSSSISPMLSVTSASFQLVAVMVAMLFVDAAVTLQAFGGFGLIYLFVMWVTRKRALALGQSAAHNSIQLVKHLQEGLGGIRDILINGSQDVFCKIYENTANQLHRAHGVGAFITSSPRIAVEALGMILIAVLAYSLAHSAEGISQAVPVLATFAVGAQRLLPILQQAYGAVSNMRGGQASLQETLEFLEQVLPVYANLPTPVPLPFLKRLEIKHVSFRHSPQTPYVLKEFNLTVDRGSCIGFIGTTGSGKSTLLDVIMGLLLPTTGTLEVDGVSVTESNRRQWQAHIAHVPQTIFLADCSVEENIAFGVPIDKIDHALVIQVARQAQIEELTKTLPKKYQTPVGERGARLSGGQRQRIGIARALYKQADVLIFDEATSALDSETEGNIISSLRCLGRDITIFMVAHRLTTLKDCTQIVELCNGRILRTGNYQDIVGQAYQNQT